MKLALIPPTSLLGDTRKTSMQMMLPGPILDRDTEYIHCYRRHCHNPDQYVILDNGAAERKQISHDMLFDMAANWRPNELVLPDFLADGPATLKASETFIQHQEVESLINMGVKLAFVVQGRDEDHAFETLEIFSVTWWAQHIKVLHFPRLLITPQAPEARLRTIIKAEELLGNKFEYHMLGANTLWPGEIKYASHIPYIRSMDTSAPYYMAHWQRPLDAADKIWEAPLERPSNYFIRNRAAYHGSDFYVRTFLAWAEGREPSATPSTSKV